MQRGIVVDKNNAPREYELLARNGYTNEAEVLAVKRSEIVQEERGGLFFQPFLPGKIRRCPFAHFVNYGLRPWKEEFYEMEPDVGELSPSPPHALSQELTVEGRSLG